MPDPDFPIPKGQLFFCVRSENIAVWIRVLTSCSENERGNKETYDFS